MKRKPNFFLIGAAKSGTTSLADYLNQHTDVFMSDPKEPNFFALPENEKPQCKGPLDSDYLYDLLLKYSVSTLEDYENIFVAGKYCHAIGEASVRYLYDPNAAQRIAQYNSQARIIVLLRNPIDRLYSHYNMNVGFRIEDETLENALMLEDQRYDSGWGWDWHYTRVSCYGEQLERYYNVFDPDQILVLHFDDLKHDAQSVVQRVYAHIGVEPEFSGCYTKKKLVGHAPRSKAIHKLFDNSNRLNKLAKEVLPVPIRKKISMILQKANRGSVPSMSDSLRKELKGVFEKDQKRLEKLIGVLPW